MAWDVTVGPICELSYDTDSAQVLLTHDPDKPEFSIAITRPEPWPKGTDFRMQFMGLDGFVIGTDRHVLSADGRTLTVTDSGFGNVLAGLAAGGTALAMSGGVTEALPLKGAADPVETFRVCRPQAGV